MERPKRIWTKVEKLKIKEILALTTQPFVTSLSASTIKIVSILCKLEMFNFLNYPDIGSPTALRNGNL